MQGIFKCGICKRFTKWTRLIREWRAQEPTLYMMSVTLQPVKPCFYQAAFCSHVWMRYDHQTSSCQQIQQVFVKLSWTWLGLLMSDNTEQIVSLARYHISQCTHHTLTSYLFSHRYMCNNKYTDITQSGISYTLQMCTWHQAVLGWWYQEYNMVEREYALDSFTTGFKF